MRRILASCIVMATTVLAQAGACAAEGRVSELQAQPLDPQRVSKYTEERGATLAAPQKSAKSHSVRGATKTAELKSVRPSSPTAMQKISNFSFFDASSTLLDDRDGDGFHREFRVRFDADVVSGSARVFARLYLRRVGDRDWLLYHETDDFDIFEDDGDDDYFVTATLDDGWPTGDYDVLVNLYESGFDGIVATIGPFDSDGLALLPLEETGLDQPIELPGYSIRGVTTQLLIDDDGDGHYSKFRVTWKAPFVTTAVSTVDVDVFNVALNVPSIRSPSAGAAWVTVMLQLPPPEVNILPGWKSAIQLGGQPKVPTAFFT